MHLPDKFRQFFWSVILLLTLFYAGTAVVFSEGEVSERLVVRGGIGILPSYGGGEEGAWARFHPNQPTPWWLSRNLIVLADGSPEIVGSEWWLQPYIIGWLLLAVFWIGFLCVTGVRWVRAKRASPAHS